MFCLEIPVSAAKNTARDVQTSRLKIFGSCRRKHSWKQSHGSILKCIWCHCCGYFRFLGTNSLLWTSENTAGNVQTFLQKYRTSVAKSTSERFTFQSWVVLLGLGKDNVNVLKYLFLLNNILCSHARKRRMLK